MAGRNALAPPPALDPGAGLFLDFDGTLVPIEDKPDAVRADARLRAVLARLLRRFDGAVAIVSGRPASQIRELIQVPGLFIAGSHGAELSAADGASWAAAPSPALPAVLARLDAFARDHIGVTVERKPHGAALHYRLAPDTRDACMSVAAALAQDWGFALQTGKMVVEIKPASADKGTAVDALMQSPPMAGRRPVFVGDDDTDEAGFVAAERRGGFGIRVDPAGPTAARYALPGVGETLIWLETAGGDA